MKKKYGRTARMTGITLQLPNGLVSWLRAEAKRERCTPSRVARQAIADYYDRRKLERRAEELDEEVR